MSAFLRGIWKLDRSYFFAACAFIAAGAASLYLGFAKIFVDHFSDGTSQSYTAIEVNGGKFVIFLVLPLVITGGPLLVLPRSKQKIKFNHRVNSVITSLVMVAFTGAASLVIGLAYYLPALIFSIASSAALFFGRDGRPGQRMAPRDDIRMSGKTKKDRRAERRTPERGPGGGRKRDRNG